MHNVSKLLYTVVTPINYYKMAGEFTYIDEDSVVSLKDIVEEEQQLQDTANAVFGDSDDTNCTYPKGYVSRQALYACYTCSTASSHPAGICLACSLNCHEGHDLYELYTKRNFRCDCGNNHFDGVTCHLYPMKDDVNPNNSYNQNFNGLYCTCHRPYPDPEDEIEDEMLQCIVCEDWYHTRHLGVGPPENYEEMICNECMNRLPFLRCYQIHSVTSHDVANECPDKTGRQASLVNSATAAITTGTTSTATTTTNASAAAPTTTTTTTTTTTSTNNKLAVTQALEVDNKTSNTSVKPHSHTNEFQAHTASIGNPDDFSLVSCHLNMCNKLFDGDVRGPGYFLSEWRIELCKCSKCVQMYKDNAVEYLCDVKDSVMSYEDRGSKPRYIHESGLDALQSVMGHVQQVEMINGYNHMKQELSKFLKDFANSGKVVKPRDIDDFFGELQNQKRRRLESGEGVPPYDCQ